MGRLERLLARYESVVSLPWLGNLAGAQRVWFAVHDPADERRLRPRLGEFELATRRAGHVWRLLDLANEFPNWLAAQEYREGFFADPERVELPLSSFRDAVVQQVIGALTQDPPEDANTVLALTGTAELFPFLRVSELVARVEGRILGRLLVFFPGEYENNQYRFLDAREGWNYLALPIVAPAEGAIPA